MLYSSITAAYCGAGVKLLRSANTFLCRCRRYRRHGNQILPVDSLQRAIASRVGRIYNFQ